MAWSTSDIPPLAGRVAVVTGANGGLGLETALALARAGADVVMAARDAEKAENAEQRIRRVVPDASLTIVALDLGSLASVRTASAEILAKHDRVDILVNNAGLMGIPEQQTTDGFEMQFGVNHLGHFALTSHLLAALLRAEAARIVSVTSTAHHMGHSVDPKNPHLHGNYTPWRAYGQSKLANFHFGIGLHRMLSNAGARASSLIAHPGLSNTDLQTTSVVQTDGGQSQRFWQTMAVRTGMSPARRRTSTVASGNGSACEERAAIRTALHQLWCTRAKADPATNRLGRCDQKALGRVRTRNGPHDRRCPGDD